jgi:hypothetical protein
MCSYVRYCKNENSSNPGIDTDHELLWQSAAAAAKNMTHDYHAWAMQEALRSL